MPRPAMPKPAMPRPAILAALLAAGLLSPLLPVPALAPAAQAQEAAPDAAALAGLLRMDETFAIMAEEGRVHGDDLEEAFFPGRGGAHWDETVAAIYDTARLRDRFLAAFAAAYAGHDADLAAAAAFFGTDLGQRILRLEIEARRAMLDPDITEEAEVQAEKMKEARDPRLRLIRDLIEAGDLLEMNVAAALTANLEFTRGLAETAPQDIPAEEMMADVWGQEAATRASTSTWLFSYMALAYGPLTDADLGAYVDFWETPAGQTLNAALFAGFDAAFAPVSRDLGLATGRIARGIDI